MHVITPIAKQDKGRLLLVAVMLSLSVALVALALPRFRAAYQSIAVENSLLQARKKTPILAEKLPTLIDAANQSISLNPDPLYWQALGELYTLKGSVKGITVAEKSAAFNASLSNFQAALLRSPANPLGWFELGYMLKVTNADTESIKQALMLSILTGPHEANLVIPRLLLILPMTNAMSDEDLASIRHQITTAWEQSAKSLAKKLAKDKSSLQIIKTLIQSSHPDLLNQIEKAVEKIH